MSLITQNLKGFVEGAGLSFNRPTNYFNVTADMSNATWNTIASHEIAQVTGMVRVRILIECTETLADAADGASIQFGREGSTAAFIASTGAAGAGGNTINAGEIWILTRRPQPRSSTG
jgi:hypothetical protein